MIAKLKSLMDKGLSTSEIGKRLGFTKNAVVGKINRLGLNAKPKPPAAKQAKPAAKSAPKKAAPSPAAAPKNSAESKIKAGRIIQHSAALMALRPDQCRWPTGNPDADDFSFCGEKCFAGKPYCFEHCKVAYQFAPAKKK
jgi:GcrA cell cycle regulator